MKYVRWYEEKTKIAQATEFVRCADGCVGLLWRKDSGEIGMEKFHNLTPKSAILRDYVWRYVVPRNVREMIWKI